MDCAFRRYLYRPVRDMQQPNKLLRKKEIEYNVKETIEKGQFIKPTCLESFVENK